MKFSLRKKTVLMITTICLIISVVSILSCRKGVSDIIKMQYSSKAEDLADTTAGLIDADQVKIIRDDILAIYDHTEPRVSNEEWGSPAHEEYLSHFSSIEDKEEYQSLRNWLRQIQDKNHIDCMYLVFPDTEEESYIYLVDAAYEDVCYPGSFDYFTEIDKVAMKTPKEGMITEITNKEEYGALLTSGKPILDKDGELVAIVSVDVSMEEITKLRNFYILVMAGILLILAAIMSAVGSLVVDRFIIHPVNILSEASLEYCDENAQQEHHSFGKLDIRTGDEIEALANSMVRMEQDINEHISNLMKTTRELISSREHELELDKIANIDAMTRVQNKRAYEQETNRLNRAIDSADSANLRFGIAMVDLNNLKKINDVYGHEKGDIAITNLCALVCSIFRYSSIFRIGGDEFVVILEGDDLDFAQELLTELNEELKRRQMDDSLELWDKTSAAIGCAFYIPGKDKNVESVFRRADSIMYENKKKMKESQGNE